MWQDVIVYSIIALAGGLTLWRFYQKFTGKSSCGGGCSCSGSCSSGGAPGLGTKPSGPGLPMSGGDSCCCR
jgi:hypothetical protein